MLDSTPQAPIVAGASRFFDRNQFVVWQAKPKGNGKLDKIPVSPNTGLPIDAHDPQHWLTFEAACEAARRGGYGVGFTFTADDPYFFLDMDDCRDGDAWSTAALDVLARFSGAAVEASCSRTGLHVVGRCDQAAMVDRKRKWGGWLECYTDRRFMAFGHGWKGDPDADHTAALLELVPMRPAVEPPVLAAPGAAPVVSDADVLDKLLTCRSAAAAFRDKASGADLWQARADVLAKHWPEGNRGDGAPFDRSSADAALCARLMFWTGNNVEQTDRLFRQSGLMRPKWERAGYRERTLTRVRSANPHDWSVSAHVAENVGAFETSQLAMAESSASNSNGELKFDVTTKRWHLWAGTVWDSRDLVESKVRNYAARIAEHAANNSVATTSQRNSILSEKTVSAIVKLARDHRDVAVSADNWNRHLHLIGTPGGTVDLRTGTLRASEPTEGITRSTRVAPDGDCPMWLQLIDHVSGGDADVARFLQQWAGYSLTGETREQSLFCLSGESGSGKSTFAEVLAHAFGTYSINVPLDVLLKKRNDRHSTEIARLNGPHFAYSSEASEGRTWDDGLIKRLSASFQRAQYQPQGCAAGGARSVPCGSSRHSRLDDRGRRRLVSERVDPPEATTDRHGRISRR